MGRHRNGNRYDAFDSDTVNMIKATAAKVSRAAGFRPHERQDVEQELAIFLLDKLGLYDANRASFRTFVSRVIAHKATDLVVTRNAQKRGARLTSIPLDTFEDDDAFGPGTDDLCNSPWVDQSTVSLAEFLILRADVERIVTSLPADLQDMCVRLLTENVSEIAQSRGVSRSSVYGSIHRLREAFAALGRRPRR
jgi:RNA polymerase sigma-70 factor (ECF subfamily)